MGKPAEQAASMREAGSGQGTWRQRVPWWRRGLAGSALLIAGLATAWLMEQGPYGAVGIIVAFLIAIPVFTTSRNFGRVALAIALIIFPLAVIGVFFALFVYLPAAIMLLLAWLADPGVRPRIAAVLVGLDCGVILLMTVVWTIALYRSA
jgi:hypothetical protein